jgi:hypothetical protein
MTPQFGGGKSRNKKLDDDMACYSMSYNLGPRIFMS